MNRFSVLVLGALALTVMPIDFYYMSGSAPCRSVMLCAKALGIELNLKPTDLMKGEHMTPEFLAMNPQHTIPTMNDNGFCLWESRAIMAYLVNQYGKDDSLYPKDPKKRAVVDQRLYFDVSTLYARFGDLYYPFMFGKAPLEQEKIDKLNDALGFLDTFLAKSEFAAGDCLTIADLTLIASITTIEAARVDLSKYKNIQRWMAKVKTTAPGYDETDGKGSADFKFWFDSMTKGRL